MVPKLLCMLALAESFLVTPAPSAQAAATVAVRAYHPHHHHMRHRPIPPIRLKNYYWAL